MSQARLYPCVLPAVRLWSHKRDVFTKRREDGPLTQDKRTSSGSARGIVGAPFDEAYREQSELLYSIHELSRLISTHADKHMASAGITHVQWWALMHVFEQEGLTQSELAEVMQMGRAALGKLVERLEAKRWIERRVDRKDSRIRRVFLRQDAAAVFAHMTDEARALFGTFLAGISPTEARRLLAGIRKIRRNAHNNAPTSGSQAGPTPLPASPSLRLRSCRRRSAG